MYRCWSRFGFAWGYTVNYCNMCGTVLRLCTGANVSWDGALAFIPADYVSSEEVRCNVPSLAMTMRLGKTWEPNDFQMISRGIRSCGTWQFLFKSETVGSVFQWSLLNGRSRDMVRRDSYSTPQSWVPELCTAAGATWWRIARSQPTWSPRKTLAIWCRQGLRP